jgi:biopolymer transport protein TolR
VCSSDLVELPSMGKSSATPATPLEVMLREDGALILRDRGGNDPGQELAETALAEAVRTRLQANPGQPVVISADKKVRYERVMRVMDTLQTLGVARVGLLVKPATR